MSKQRPRSPKQAARRGGPIDSLLDSSLFKALADPTRVKLLACLAKCGRACSVTEVAECCNVDFSVVSRHMTMLAGAGLTEAEKTGRTVHHRVRYGAISQRLRKLADAIDACCPSSETSASAGCSPDKCGC